MHNKVLKSFLFTFDFVTLNIALYLMLVIDNMGMPSVEFYLRHLFPMNLLFVLWMVSFFIEGLYSLREFKNSGLSVSLLKVQIVNAIVGFLFFYIFPLGITPKTNVIVLALLSAWFLFLNRKILFKIFSYEAFSINVSLYGNSETIDEISSQLQERPYLGFRILGRAKCIEQQIDQSADLIVIDKNENPRLKFEKEVLELLRSGQSWTDMGSFYEVITGKVSLPTLNDFWFVENCGIDKSASYRFSKQLIDSATGLLILLLTIPLFLLLFPVLLVTQGRPFFYSQVRTGLRGKDFKIYKLRTMRVDAEKDGAKWAKPKDDRITPIGSFLRLTRIDELPQAWNILRGDMSLVGPRPERPEIISEKLEGKIPFYHARHLVRPGVTGWAQVNFRYGFSEEDTMEKLQYDLYYVKNQSIWLDIKTILKTIKIVLAGGGQ